MPGDKDRALAAGCDDFMAKPIDDLVLVEMVSSLLARR
jgi:CheY-like chemotaxis protein